MLKQKSQFSSDVFPKSDTNTVEKLREDLQSFEEITKFKGITGFKGTENTSAQSLNVQTMYIFL